MSRLVPFAYVPQRPDLVQFPGFSVRGDGKEQGGTQAAGVSKYKKLWSEANAGESCRGSMAVLDRSVEQATLIHECPLLSVSLLFFLVPSHVYISQLCQSRAGESQVGPWHGILKG